MSDVQTIPATARRHGETDERYAARLARYAADEQAGRERAAAEYAKQRAREERSKVVLANQEAFARKAAVRLAAFLRAKVADPPADLVEGGSFDARRRVQSLLSAVAGVYGPDDRQPPAGVPKYPTVLAVAAWKWQPALYSGAGDRAVITVEARSGVSGVVGLLARQGGLIDRLLTAAPGSGRWSRGVDAMDTRRWAEDLTVSTDMSGGRPLAVTSGYVWHACEVEMTPGGVAVVPPRPAAPPKPKPVESWNYGGDTWIDVGGNTVIKPGR